MVDALERCSYDEGMQSGSAGSGLGRSNIIEFSIGKASNPLNLPLAFILRLSEEREWPNVGRLDGRHRPSGPIATLFFRRP